MVKCSSKRGWDFEIIYLKPRANVGSKGKK